MINYQNPQGKQDTQAVSADTQAVSADTQAVSADTQAVSADTQAVSADTQAVSADTQAVSTDTQETKANNQVAGIVGVVVDCKRLNIRKRPTKNSDVLCILDFGAEVTVKSVSHGWANVVTSDGVEGFAVKEYID